VEVVDDVVDIQVVLPSLTTLGILIEEMVLLVASKLLLLPTESVDTTREVREYNILWRDTVSYDVEVGCVNGNAVGIAALDALEHDIAGQPRGRRNETTICELGCDARHYYCFSDKRLAASVVPIKKRRGKLAQGVVLGQCHLFLPPHRRGHYFSHRFYRQSLIDLPQSKIPIALGCFLST